jgi:gliding motility-associated-like protein
MQLFRIFIIVVLCSLYGDVLAGCGSTTEIPCTSASPFCSDQSYVFPNATCSTAPSGPNYGCVSSAEDDNPIWYYMQIGQSGNIRIDIEQTVNQNGTGAGLDVDFVLWGPFSSVASGCSAIMSGSSPIQSGYSSSSTETIGIGVQGGSFLSATGCIGVTTPPAAVAGQFYIVVITNYDGDAGYISFNQTNTGSPGAGSADCAIVTPCDITALTANPSSCNASGQYTLTGSVTFVSAPSTGTLTITNTAGGSQTFTAPFTSPLSYSFPAAAGNGGTFAVTASFSADGTCSRTTNFTAPTCGCTVTASNSGPVCSGTSFDLTASNVAGATSYTWSGPSGYSSTTQNPTGISAPSSGSLTYTVSVNSSSGACTASTTVAVNPTPSVPTTSVVAPTCAAPGTASISNYSGTNTYNFSPAGPTVGGGGAISGLTAGSNYTVTATQGTCTSTASVPFSVAAQLVTPVTPDVTTSPATCSADGGATLSNYSGTEIYTFNPTGPSVNASGVISGLVPGTSYTLSSTNGSCTSTSSAFTIAAQLTTPAVPSISTVSETCTADGTASISNYLASNSYVFSPTGPSAGSGGAISGMTYGTTYTVTSSNGSCTSTASAPFSISEQLPVPVLTLVNQSICSPNTVNLTNPSVASTDIGTLAYYSNAALTSTVANPSAVGNGTYYIQSTSGSCSTSGSLTVTVTTTPTLTLNDQDVCSPLTVDLTDPAVASTDVGTMGYYSDAALSVPVSNPSSVGQGTYYLEATNGSCSFSGILNVTVTTTPNLLATSQSICTPFTVDLTDPAVVSTDVGTIGYYTNSGLTISVADPTSVTSGTYYVQAVNGICSSTASLSVTITTTPSLTLNNQQVCQPATVDLTDPSIVSTSTGTVSYYSDVALTSPIADPTSVGNGTYYVEATNGSCSFSGIVQVVVIPLPIIDPLTPAPACGTYTLPIITGANLVAPSYWTGSGQTGTQLQTGDVVNSSQTVYMFAGSPGCSDEETVVITVNPIPEVVSVINGGEYCIGETVNNVVANVSGTGPWTINYTLNGASQVVTSTTNPVVFGNTEGVYVVNDITDANCSNGASGTDQIVIKVCEIVVPSAFTPNGDLVNDLWDIVSLDEVFPDNQIAVFNRWGEKVFESVKGNYASKPWDGKLNGTLLPVGSYFYILDPGDGSDKRNGSVSIILKK